MYKPLMNLTAAFMFASVTTAALASAPEQNGFICKAYISTAYSKPISIINHFKTDNQGLTYVKYRRDDGKTFKYVCDVKKSSVIYSMWDNYSDNWGRWRNDEAGAYSINGGTLTISDPMSGKKAFKLP